MPLSILLPLIAQAAALNGPGVAGLNLPQIDRPARSYESPLAPSRIKSCLDGAQNDAKAAEATARAWLKDAQKGSLASTAQPQLCLGLALALQEDWEGAEQAFTAGHAASASDALLRAQLGGMAGNAALAQNAPTRALPLLEAAYSEAQSVSRPLLAGGIALDRARALVALKRSAEAENVLADARVALPDDPQAWLLSATLARRMSKLDEAQKFIENAANIAPRNAEIGVEAGVIAMLAGHEDAARKSWTSALAADPSGEAGKRASAYLAQLGPAPQP
jgi:tetratricopeptide (TPR) repeat protein